jgi:large subunit ribosomal protein L15
MMIHDITAKVGPHKKRKRVGRGEASGHGGTSTRGHKGAKSRAGWVSRPSYAGGATPFARRFPKRGFSNAGFRTEHWVTNVRDLEKHFEAGATVDIDALVKLGLVPNAKLPLKVLGSGDIKKKLTVVAGAFSASAKSKIEAAGGSCKEAPSKSQG